jgi:hypothetical protein
VALLPPVPPWPGPATEAVTMALGPEQIRFSKTEFARLTEAVATVARPAQPIHLP